jgi:exodeoxyribonuclease V alpha subunit
LRPESLGGLVPFLANNVRGVGEKTASRFVESLGLTSMDHLVAVCRDEPQKIQGFFGKRHEVAADVIQAIVGDAQYRSIMMFLHENNIPPRFARKIYDRYAGRAVDVLRENPYRLIRDFRNVGFRRADAIAQKIGIPWNSRFRVEAAFVFVLERAQDEGHCCLDRDSLLRRAAEVLKGEQDVDPRWLLNELREIYRANQKEGGDLRSLPFTVRQSLASDLPNTSEAPTASSERSEVLFYLPDMLDMENRVAHHCRSLLANSGMGREAMAEGLSRSRDALESDWPEIPWAQLSDEQFEAVLASVDDPFMILTGGPGCGKTFVLRAIFKLQQVLKRSVALCAPTGLAAKRMSLSVGAPATTLHKLLGLGRRPAASDGAMGLDAGATEFVETTQGVSMETVDTIICDEASMLSVDLLLALLEAMGTGKRLILVGDVDQLPSVGPGQCLRDLIASEQVRVCRLTKIFRQSGASPIPLAARQIITGHRPLFDHKSYSPELPERRDFVFFGCKQENFYETLFGFLRQTVPSQYGFDPVRDVQILVPMRKSLVGQDEINRRMQEEFNPPNDTKSECSLRGGLFRLREGDKVIQTRNNYERDLCNGDMGYVRVVRVEGGVPEVDVLFQDRVVRLKDEEVDDLQLCYAMTVHKSQGSEFPMCIVPMFSAYYAMLYRNLLYTAVTRASQSVIMLGEDWALGRAVGNADATRRITALESLLRASALRASGLVSGARDAAAAQNRPALDRA